MWTQLKISLLDCLARAEPSTTSSIHANISYIIYYNEHDMLGIWWNNAMLKKYKILLWNNTNLRHRRLNYYLIIVRFLFIRSCHWITRPFSSGTKYNKINSYYVILQIEMLFSNVTREQHLSLEAHLTCSHLAKNDQSILYTLLNINLVHMPFSTVVFDIHLRETLSKFITFSYNGLYW